MNWLTMKVLQYIAGALLIACIGLGVKGCALAKDRDVAVAEKNTALADKKTAITERDSWKEEAASAIAANQAYDVIFEQQRAAAEEQQRQAEAAAQQAAATVAAAKRDEAKAESEAAAYRRVYGARPKDCEAALLALDRVCPTLGGY